MEVKIVEEQDVGQKTKKVVSVQVNEDIYNYVKEYADKRYLKVSDILRCIIYDWYEDKENRELFK